MSLFTTNQPMDLGGMIGFKKEGNDEKSINEKKHSQMKKAGETQQTYIFPNPDDKNNLFSSLSHSFSRFLTLILLLTIKNTPTLTNQ